MGFTIEGLFAGFEVQEYKNEDGSVDIKKIVNVATGRNSYPVYMKEDAKADVLAKLELGTIIHVACRIYASKAGRVMCVDGELLK